jgi:hypothetical protein
MATKPQMLCALDESPFEIYWLILKVQAEVDARTKYGHGVLSESFSSMLQLSMSLSPITHDEAVSFKHMKHSLRRQSYITKKLVREEFVKPIDSDKSSHKQLKRLKALIIRLFLIHFTKALLKHTFNVLVLTRTWLFIFIFLICAIEYRRMAPTDPDITILKIIFEIISAFGGVGMSLGYPDKTTSFASVLSSGSKIILIATMLMGRHRGLLSSMKDQDVIECSAVNILVRRREEYILQFKNSRTHKTIVKEKINDSSTIYF